ncbi:DNA-binding CsgD family transcriptional regulator [Saccharothrix coeruleofusca]|uniref:LuxR C-terminal-related transcriptional regulator n=1 Tax=Saccharothrix coeruleofusca TaxID=33919 RepID=UPI0027DB162E|nr:LuxR C-terminal-related transcriptional regulator [Saccharothrix coeruleofusca]MBP2334062.1 DNA-binding CsgD family transcriptional regulator [Saccharothrix coeruleofusca]
MNADPRATAVANLREARMALDEGRPGDALESAEKAVAAFSWLDDAEGVAFGVLAQSVALGKRGLLPGALDTIDRVQRIASANRHALLQAWCGFSRAVVELRLDSRERSLHSLARALGLAELTGDAELTGSILFEQAKLMRTQYHEHCMTRTDGARCSLDGEPCVRKLRRAEALCGQARDRWKQLDEPLLMARVNLLVAHVRLDLGEVERAQRACRRAERLLAGRDRPVLRAELLIARARCSGSRNRLADQIAQLTEAAELAMSCLAREVAVRAHGALSTAHERAGQLRQALRHARLQLEQHRLWELQEGRDLLRMREHDPSARLAEQLAHHRFEPHRERTFAPPRGYRPLRSGTTAEQTNRRIARALQAGLTKRGIEVLRRVADGASTGAIAEELALSPKTVQNHLQRIYRTLGVRDRAGAAVWWIGLDDATAQP